MLSSEKITEKAFELGFEDVGFTSAEPFYSQREILSERNREYAWTKAAGLDLEAGTDPRNILPEARSIIVLMEVYFRKAYPREMESFFGRCYLDDDRMTGDGLSLRIKAFRSFLRENGMVSKVPFNLPHRLAAGRAGMGTFGKNCLFYSNKVARKSSWVLPVAFVVDGILEPGTPTLEVGCPDWCKNACLTACPTSALQGPRKIDPRRCISFLTYFGRGITPKELREPMGLWVYGCDRCQNVCPRNSPWLSATLPVNEKVAEKEPYFRLPRLLHMDRGYFESHIWSHMFYMPSEDLWRWKMNVARVMGNTVDEGYVPDLVKAFEENGDERVKGMVAWALGRIGGRSARCALDRFRSGSEGIVREEIEMALCD
ncbi:MAG: epoxyqueuosine reductase [Desulfobacteraceae bacterium]|nr:MAG: epoxyqueuosine reductase [Desulfobacteraceae bacterium]